MFSVVKKLIIKKNCKILKYINNIKLLNLLKSEITKCHDDVQI